MFCLRCLVVVLSDAINIYQAAKLNAWQIEDILVASTVPVRPSHQAVIVYMYR